MILAPHFKNEEERLKDLRRYDILDTPPEETFDEITKLAAMVCDTRISLVSLIDANRQWFKSRHGISATETPRDVSFCGHAIGGTEIFEVPNAELDNRFCDNPLFKGPPHVRFYAGAPLVTPRGTRIGTLCVIDSEEKKLTESQREILRSLAKHVVHLLELRLATSSLRNSELRHRVLFDQSVEAIVTLSAPNWKFVTGNSAALKLYGCSSIEEFKQLGPWDVSPEFQEDGEASSSKAKRMIQIAINEGIHSFEWTHKRLDGALINCLVVLSRVHENDHTYLQATVRDISAEKKARAELLESKRQLQLTNKFLERALDGARLGVWEWNFLTHEVSFHLGWEKKLGFPDGTVKSDTHIWEELIHPQDFPKFKEAVQDYRVGRTPLFELVYRMKNQTGEWLTLLSRAKFTEWDVDGTPVGFTGTSLNITETKRLENLLVEAQAIAKIGSWTYNLITHEQTWSDEHYKIFEIDGPQTQDVLYRLYRERIHPDDLVVLDGLLDRAKRFGEDFVFDHRVLLEAGTRIKHVQGIGKVSFDKDGRPFAVSGTCRDRTGDIENDERYRTLLETMSEGLVLQNAKGEIVQHNSAAERILGLTAAQLEGRTSFDPSWRAIRRDGSEFPGSEHPAMIAIRTGKPISDVMMGVSVANSEKRWILINAVPVERSDGRHALVTFADITALIRADEENRFILDTLQIGVWKFNPKSNELHWDKSMYEVFGIDERDFSGDYSAWENSLTEESKAEAIENLALALQGKKDFNTTFEIRTKVGERRHIGGKAKVIRDDSGQALMMFGINWDRTKEVELERNFERERMRAMQNAKLATIGQLAAGVGHEINNPLTIISGQAQIFGQILRSLNIEDPRLRNNLDRIDTAVDRIANIVKGLRTFARSDNNLISDFCAIELIGDTVNMLKEIYEKEGVRLNFQSGVKRAMLRGNRGRIQQVIVNLLSNAKDATMGFADPLIDVRIEVENKSLKLSCQDNGQGILPELVEKIFDPFFTTKEINKGTGIGLSIVSTIIKEHNGRIEVHSLPGAGATFTIYLPLLSEEIDVVTPQPITSKKALAELNLGLLIVDDEEDILGILQLGLQKLVRKVHCALGAKAALLLLEHEQVDVIISDIKMPNIDGFKFLEMVGEKFGSASPKFIFMSGGVDLTPEQQRIISCDVEAYLPKPFKIEDMYFILQQLSQPKAINSR